MLLKPNKTDFISDSWKEDSTIRYQMIDNLIDDKILIGKREIDIKNMLGEPTKVDSNGMWLYEIVGRTWADFTFISLIIEFKDSKVIDVEKVKT